LAWGEATCADMLELWRKTARRSWPKTSDGASMTRVRTLPKPAKG